MVDIRKIIIIFVVGLLFSVLVFSVIEAVYPEPKYEDFCKEKFMERAAPVIKEASDCKDLEVTKENIDACEEEHGVIAYDYDSRGCAIDFECNTCNYELENSREKHSQYVFYISAFLALVAIFIGLYLPAEANTLNEWIGTGFMLGGTFALFFGTMSSFRFLDRFIRPIIILLELTLVIFIAYKKMGNLKKDRKKKK